MNPNLNLSGAGSGMMATNFNNQFGGGGATHFDSSRGGQQFTGGRNQ